MIRSAPSASQARNSNARPGWTLMTSSAITLRVGCCSLGDEKYAEELPRERQAHQCQPHDNGAARRTDGTRRSRCSARPARGGEHEKCGQRHHQLLTDCERTESSRLPRIHTKSHDEQRSEPPRRRLGSQLAHPPSVTDPASRSERPAPSPPGSLFASGVARMTWSKAGNQLAGAMGICPCSAARRRAAWSRVVCPL